MRLPTIPWALLPVLLMPSTTAYQLHSPSRLHAAVPRRSRVLTAEAPPCAITVIGIGGGGGNTVNRITEAISEHEASTVRFVCMNTDVQALSASLAPETLQIGPICTRGLGAGGKPEVGEEAALESREAIEACVSGQDMVFVTAGMGGGTGSGAAAVVAKVARDAGALTVAVVSRPFSFEGGRRAGQADRAIARLRDSVDMLIVVANDRLLEIIPEGVSLADSFALADEVLRQGIVGLSDIITKPGLVNIDFADVQTVVKDSGLALLGVGTGTGRTRAEDAAEAAISSPLLDLPLLQARRAVFTVVGGETLTLQEVNTVATRLSEVLDEDANIIFGATVDPTYGDDELTVTMVATDFGDDD